MAQKAGIRYVYIGNVPGHSANHTYCPKCKKAIIKRKGYFIEEFNIKNGKCIYCGTDIPGVWE
jgi:pyruvate formate lyase activating enzyme